MKRTIIAIAFIGLGLCLMPSAGAQDFVTKAPQESTISDLDAPTPEIWLYQQQMKRYEDPKTMVRQRAEFRAAQRQKRLAAAQWFGYNNLRPRVNPVPFMYQYSPSWVGNAAYLNNWSGSGGPSVYLTRPSVRIQR